MTYSITRKIEFDAGHRVFQHESKCNNFHGHRYVLEVYARPDDGLDHLGRVIDFSVLKKVLGGWIDENWDHGFIYNKEDKLTKQFFEQNVSLRSYEMINNPTAENMAAYLLDYVCPMLFKHFAITVHKIVLWETPNCKAEVEL